MKTLNKVTMMILMGAIFVSACGGNSTSAPKELGYELAPVFREFYQSVGGEALLGKAIEKSFELDDTTYQYIVGGLLISDPFFRDGKSVYFSDLGNQLGYYEPPKTIFDELDGTYLNGYEIHDGFVALFTKIGGVEVVGYPISNANYNPENKQIEQHFENLGFFLSDGEDSAYAGLLPYGRIDCGSECSLNVFVEQQPVETLDMNLVPEPFASFINEVGGDFVGKPLTDVYDAGDGTVQIVFEKAVLYTVVGNETIVRLLPISEQLGYSVTEPSEMQESSAAYFYRVDGDVGYSIPNGVFEYLMAHGGFDVVGMPIQGVDKIEEYHYRQCFENVCMDIDVDPTTKDETVYTIDLGREFEEKIYEEPEEIFLIDEFSLDAWLASPLVGKTSEQTFFVQVKNDAKDSLKDFQLIILLTYPPDLNQERLSFPLTDVDGLAEISINPVDAQNGSRVKYEICLEDGSVCVEGKYIIWSE